MLAVTYKVELMNVLDQIYMKLLVADNLEI